MIPGLSQGGQGNSLQNTETLEDHISNTVNAGGIYGSFDPAPRGRTAQLGNVGLAAVVALGLVLLVMAVRKG